MSEQPPNGLGLAAMRSKSRWAVISLEPGERIDDGGAKGGEVIAALLHDDRWKAEIAEDTTRLAVAAGRHLERALGVACGSVDAERDDECAGGGGELRCALHGCKPGDVASAWRQREVEVAVVVLRLEA